MGFPPFSWLESSIGENRSWALARVTIGILYLALGWIPATIGFAVGLVYFFGDITLKLTVNRRMEGCGRGRNPRSSGTTIWCSGSSASRSSPAGWAGRRRRDAPLTSPAGHVTTV